MSGWFAVKHGITEHHVFRDHPARLAAWIWMLDNAAWADTKQDVGGQIIVVKRGQLCASQAMMERGTGMTRKQLRNFLCLLKAEGTIETQPATKGAKSRTIVTFCNFDKYQSPRPSEGQRRAKEGPTKEQDNNIPVGNSAFAPSIDPAKSVFESGVAILGQAGVSERQARGIVGKWRKNYSDPEIIAAISQASRDRAVEPVAYITRVLGAVATRETEAERVKRVQNAWMW